jgi:hypothetical protein
MYKLLGTLLMIMSQENALLKAKEEFQTIEHLIREATLTGKTIHTVEEELWDCMLGLGRLLLTSFVVGHGTGDIGPTLDSEGRTLRRLEKCYPKPYASVFGRLPEILRTVYGLRETQKHEVVPLDAQLALPEGDYSYLLQQWAQSFCVKGAYKDAQTDIEQILRIRPSIRALEDMNASMANDADEFRENQPLPDQKEEHELLVITADCKGVRIRGSAPKDPEGGNHARKRGPRPGTKREACVGSVYTVDRFIRTADDIVDDVVRKERVNDRPVPQNKALRAQLTREIDGQEVNGKDVIFDWIGDQIKGRQHTASQPIVCVMDGAPTLWKKVDRLMSELNIHIVCILDIFHVMDYLWDAARCVHGSDDKAAEAFVTIRLERILKGDVGRVIGGLRQILTKGKYSASKRKTLNTVIKYMDNKRSYMRYDEYLAEGYPIGSGVVEGACGHIVKDRMEGSGMRWSVPGAQSMLDLRCIYLNDNWSAFQTHRIQQRTCNMYPYRDLIQKSYKDSA